MAKTAVLVKDNLENWRGHAALYRLSEPVTFTGRVDENASPNTDRHEEKGLANHVVVASIVTSLGQPETMMFAADPDTATAVSWGEVGGFLGEASHAAVLEHKGYLLVDED